MWCYGSLSCHSPSARTPRRGGEWSGETWWETDGTNRGRNDRRELGKWWASSGLFLFPSFRHATLTSLITYPSPPVGRATPGPCGPCLRREERGVGEGTSDDRRWEEDYRRPMIHFWSLLSSHELSLPTPSPPSVHRTSLTSFVPSGGRREGMEDPTGGRRDGGNDTRWTEHDDQGTDVNAVSKPLASVLCSLRSWACHSPPFTSVLRTGSAEWTEWMTCEGSERR